MLTVNENKRTLLKDGKPFFYLADTCWSAFTSIEETEWVYYLKKRKSQGFNTLQINILPQWDRSIGSFDMLPFAMDENGKFDFTNIDDAYFERARKMSQIATEEGFSLALVVLWSNYVPGTWASEMDNRNVMPISFLEGYLKRVVAAFNEFSPIYLVSGDTDFPTDETKEMYERALDYLSENAQDCLKTLHIRGRLEEIPEELAKKIDLYLYQSGHNSSFLNMPYYLAKVFHDLSPKKPVINSEPCYEQMGYSRNVYGRFSQRDTRRAAWQSVLSGACAGVTYGAHGIWSWQEIDSNYSSAAGEAFDLPLLWQDALKLPGAWDYGYLRNILELFDVSELEPCNDLLMDVDEQVRFAKAVSKDCYVLYIPSNTTVKVNCVFSNYSIKLIDLKTKNFIHPKYFVKDNVTTFLMHSCEEDVVIIIKGQGDRFPRPTEKCQ
ncbi:DUF4038 domain-containing protein [Cytobacillus sp. Hz8]|uniref:apiosidase-like domain-containing protein n=1 Tax=Cytobacillus sp. Hz8 TaxID=3347168 RepID=UPI0035E101D1